MRETYDRAIWMIAGAIIGSGLSWAWAEKRQRSKKKCELEGEDAGGEEERKIQYDGDLVIKRHRLPQFVLLLRHGESEANADHTLWRTKPDNQIRLSPRGRAQARQAGRRIENFFRWYEAETKRKIQRVHIHVSPFERTIQTSAEARKYFEHRVVRTCPESRIREQEFGNMSNKDSAEHRSQQQKVGRFWYRFPTGESGCDVLDRVKSWWSDSFLPINERVGYDPVDAVVVVTHGLTMRFLLMQLYSWSPNTFNSVWNARNCDIYILTKDLSKPGISPYILDTVNGDKPESTVDLVVRCMKKDSITGEPVVMERQFKLFDYLSIPPPRTIQTQAIKERLVEQYPEDIRSTKDILQVLFKPFTNDKNSSDVENNAEEWRRVSDPIDSVMVDHDSTDSLLVGQVEDDNTGVPVESDDGDDDDDYDDDDNEITRNFTRAEPEKSYRWPCKYT